MVSVLVTISLRELLSQLWDQGFPVYCLMARLASILINVKEPKIAASLKKLHSEPN